MSYIMKMSHKMYWCPHFTYTENAAQRDENDIIRVHTVHKEPAWYLTRSLPNSKGCLLLYNTFSPWLPPQRKKNFIMWKDFILWRWKKKYYKSLQILNQIHTLLSSRGCNNQPLISKKWILLLHRMSRVSLAHLWLITALGE